MPDLKSVIVHTWWRGSAFFKKAFTVIVLGLLTIQVLGSVEWGSWRWTGNIEPSILAVLGEALKPFFRPVRLGLEVSGSGDFRFCG